MGDYNQTYSLPKRTLRITRSRLRVNGRLFYFVLLLLTVSLVVFLFLNSPVMLPTAPLINSHSLEKPWVTADTDSYRLTTIIKGRVPGTAWRDTRFNAVVSLSKKGSLAYIHPPNRRRAVAKNSDAFREWDSIYQPNEKYTIPAWATPEESLTLRHATIFTSLASFRDYECALTLRNLFSMAVAPHRLYVGISEERKPSDASCLALIGARNLNMAEVRRVLYGEGAPIELSVELRNFSWEDVVHPRKLLDVDAEITLPLVNSSEKNASPPGVFVHPKHAAERLSCVAGELETTRDAFLLAENDAQRAKNGTSIFRRGRGGPQQEPSRALAGCRITTRVADSMSARGPTFGRYITSLFFFDQDYFMVIDSHTRFAVDWDVKLISRVFQMPTRGVLSYYPNGYTEKNDRAEFDKTHTMLMCTAQVLANGMPKLGARWVPFTPHPVPQGFAAAGFMFGDAQFVLDSPFDPFLPYMFDGEEILFSARMWTAGWDLYGPGQSVVFHNYDRPQTPKYFEILRMNENARRVLSELRTLYMLRRAQPWAEVLVRRGYTSPDGQSTVKPLPPVEAPETRLIVTDAAAFRKREISVWVGYYGMGSVRPISQYWEYTELTDRFVKRKDSEHRWMGGTGLCDKVTANLTQ